MAEGLGPGGDAASALSSGLAAGGGSFAIQRINDQRQRQLVRVALKAAGLAAFIAPRPVGAVSAPMRIALGLAWR